MKCFSYDDCKLKTVTVSIFADDGGSWCRSGVARVLEIVIYSSYSGTGSNNEALPQKFFYGQQY